MKKTKIKQSNHLRDLAFLQLLKDAKLPVPESEFRFHPERKWRFDFAYVEQKIAIEIEGALYVKNKGHNSVTGILRDIEKYNEAAILGWKLIRIPSHEIHKAKTIDLIIRALNKENEKDYVLQDKMF